MGCFHQAVLPAQQPNMNQAKGGRMAYHFRNLVFEGGGVKGIAYVGALKALEEKEVLQKIERVGGTSAGAIVAVLVSLGFTTEEIQKKLWEMEFGKFADSSKGFLRNAHRILQSFGWCKGDYFKDWMGAILREKTQNSRISFAELEAMKKTEGYRSLYLMGTNLSTSFPVIFSAENEKYARMPIVEAVRISMSIPFFFTAPRDKTAGTVYSDGGLLDNYPVKLFDMKKYSSPGKYTETDYYRRINAKRSETEQLVYNKETLGFRLSTKEQIAMLEEGGEPSSQKITSVMDYTKAVIQAMLAVQENGHLHKDDWDRTVYIDTLGVKTTDFSIGPMEKRALITSGSDGTKAYFKWYDGATNRCN